MRHCGYARVAYNCALSDFKDGLDSDEWRSLYDLKRRFNARKFEVFDWCKELSQNVSKNAIHNFNDAVGRWKNKQNRFPKFKKKSSRKSYQADNSAGTIKVNGKRIFLPKVGWVKMHEFLRFDGVISRVVVSKTAHRWFVSILVEVPDVQIICEDRKPAVSVDVGINFLAVTLDGIFFENPKPLKRFFKKLRRAQRRLSRAIKGSANWHKCKDRVARIHYGIACIRFDAQHKASTAIVKSASVICVESLNVAGMLKNRKLSKALSDSGLHSFLSMIKYKAESLGVPIVEASRFYPSSKTCSSCSAVKESLSLSDRVFDCADCGQVINRDLNAALNLKHLAESCSES